MNFSQIFKGITITSFALGLYNTKKGINIRELQTKVEDLQNKNNALKDKILECQNSKIQEIEISNEVKDSVRSSLDKSNKTIQEINQYIENNENIDTNVIQNNLEKVINNVNTANEKVDIL